MQRPDAAGCEGVVAVCYPFARNSALSQLHKTTSRMRPQVGAVTYATKGKPLSSPASSCRNWTRLACMPTERRLTNSVVHGELIKHAPFYA